MAKKAYEIITDQILEKLETGKIPWQKPWKGGKAGVPKNLVSKKPYRGINIFLLGMQCYGNPWWLAGNAGPPIGLPFSVPFNSRTFYDRPTAASLVELSHHGEITRRT